MMMIRGISITHIALNTIIVLVVVSGPAAVDRGPSSVENVCNFPCGVVLPGGRGETNMVPNSDIY